MTKTAQLKRTISLPSEHSDYIEKQVANGKYASASEVVRAGLRALQERDKVFEDWILKEIAPAYENYKNNPQSGISLQDAMQRLDKIIDSKNA